MNPAIKRLLGAILLIGSLGVSSLMAMNAEGQTLPPVESCFLDTTCASGEFYHG